MLEWKHITMDFVVGLLVRDHNAIWYWLISRPSQLINMNNNSISGKLLDYIDSLYLLYYDRDLRFTSMFWKNSKGAMIRYEMS